MSNTSPISSEVEPESASKSKPIVYPIELKRKHYETLEMLLYRGQKGQITFKKFEKAMGDIGFESRQMAGSTFRVDHKKLAPFGCHRPHGTGDAKMDGVLMINIASRMEDGYGWTMDSFRIRKR